MQCGETVDACRVHNFFGNAVGEDAHRRLCECRTAAAVSFHTHRVHDRVGSAAVGGVAQALEDVVGEVERLDAVLLGQGAALGHGVNSKNPVTEVAADAGNKLADRAESHHSENTVVGQLRVLHTLPGGGEDVAEKEVALVG